MGNFMKKYGLIIALAVLAILVLMPTPTGLSIAGHRVLALLVFSVIVWMTECVSFSTSAMIILGLIVLLIGFSPDPKVPGKIIGTAPALLQGLDGFKNSAWALVGSAMCIAIAMTKTGLDRRIALNILSVVGAKTNRILIGVFITGFLLSLIVPSSTARVACVVPIVMGIVSAFGLEKNSKFSMLLIIAVAQADSIWNLTVKTAAAQNLVTANFILKDLKYDVSWGEWFYSAVPFGIVMAVCLYFVLLWAMPPEVKEIENGKEIVREKLTEIGKITMPELKLLIISLILLTFWILEKKTWSFLGIGGDFGKMLIHPFDTSSSTILAIMTMLIPGIGIIEWGDIEKKLSWGTLFLFAIGISLGTLISTTGAGKWLGTEIVTVFGLKEASTFMIIAIMAAVLIVVHLGFASATALASAMIPIVIGVFQTLMAEGTLTQHHAVGMTMILQYVVCFGFILPVNAPQNMIAYGTGTFTTKDFMKVGLPFTVIGYELVLLFTATYWKRIDLL